MGRIGVATLPRPKGGRLPKGVGGREQAANRRRGQSRTVGAVATTVAGAASATEIISVAGSAVVTPRLSSKPMRQPRPVEGVSWDGGAAPGRISQGRCPMLELLASKGARAVLRGRGHSNVSLLPDRRTEVGSSCPRRSSIESGSPGIGAQSS